MKNVIMPLLTVSTAFVLANQANASVIWSTIDGTTGTPGQVDSGNVQAQSFIVPNTSVDANAWLINSVGILFETGTYNASDTGNFVVEIWGSSGGYPDPSNQSAAGTTTATTSDITTPGVLPIQFNFGGLRREAGQYWVVVSYTGGTINTAKWTSSSSSAAPAQPQGAGDGDTYYASSIDGGANWLPDPLLLNSEPYEMALDATVVPEPATFGLIGGLGLLGFAGWRRYSRK